MRVGILYGCFLIMFLGLFFFIMSYSKSKFVESELENAMTSVSISREITGDPCLYSILGDPLYAKDMYAKLNIYCSGDNKQSKNSVDLNAVNGDSIYDLFREVGRVNGFKVTLNNNNIELGELKNTGGINNWNCYYGLERILDFNEKLKKSSSISCFYGLTDAQIGHIRNE